jgi:hypothetical protein
MIRLEKSVARRGAVTNEPKSPPNSITKIGVNKTAKIKGDASAHIVRLLRNPLLDVADDPCSLWSCPRLTGHRAIVIEPA